ncbi:unnamed protein product [Staurois parvus]|uniref:Uncharacterized protein n=1 Tax=Staurois parvus TaxID=386267 RepID=A0ABN9D457_9NEOB|nr:unnamed protein product [Staurois parvus]
MPYRATTDTQTTPETSCPTGLPRHAAPSRNFVPYRATKTLSPIQKLHALQGFQDTQTPPETSCPTGLPRHAAPSRNFMPLQGFQDTQTPSRNFMPYRATKIRR